MPDAVFAHHRLAPIYDAFEGNRADLTAYLNIAGVVVDRNADTVLDTVVDLCYRRSLPKC